MEQKTEFINTLRESSDKGSDSLTEVIVRIASKPDHFNFDEICELLTSSEHDFFWNCVHLTSTSLLGVLENESEEEVGQFEKCVSQLRPIAALIMHFISTFQFRPEALLDSIQGLHDVLVPLEETIAGARELKVVISKICEHCWTEDEEGAEAFIPQLIPHLLLTALEADSPDVNVKRLYTIRDAFCLLDYEDPSIQTIQGLLLRCFVDTKFLRVRQKTLSHPPYIPCVIRVILVVRLRKVEGFCPLYSVFIKVSASLNMLFSLLINSLPYYNGRFAYAHFWSVEASAGDRQYRRR